MEWCLNYETALERVQAKAKQTKDELGQLNKWKSTMEQKFNLSEKVGKELEQRTEEARKAIEKKEKEIQDLKDKLHQAKEAAICEYRDFEALLSELGDSFLQGFDNALHQVKKAYLDLDVSNVKVEDQLKPPSCLSPQRILKIFLLRMQLKATESRPKHRMFKIKLIL